MKPQPGDMGSKNNIDRFIFWAAVISLLWAGGSLFFRISLWWNEASYYTHGWAVPLLALVLLVNRSSDWSVQQDRVFNPWIVIGVSLFIFLPARMIAEPDPFWRIPLWIETLSFCFITGSFLYYSKLRIAWQAWALTSLYLFTSLPWPAGLETKVVHGLTQLVSQFTAECLLLLGYPAVLSQGAILVDQEMISINQACSGIRSLQNLLSLSVFLSIYFRFDWARFVFVVFIAGISTLFFNFLRALTLSYVSLDYGSVILSEWHDFIGNSFVILSMGAVGLVAWLLRTSSANINKDADTLAERTGLKYKRATSFAFLFALGMPHLFTFVWFSLLVPKPPGFLWEVDLGSSAEPIETGIHDVLQFDYGAKYKFLENPGKWAEVIHFGYHQDSAAASLCSRNHPPDHCMGYTGIEIVDSHAEITYFHNGSSLIFRHYASPSIPGGSSTGLHVFWGSFSLDSRIDSFDFTHSSLFEKAQWFLSGKLSYERKVLLITISGTHSPKQAKEKLFSVLDKIVKPVAKG